jgi:hypothetical protein
MKINSRRRAVGGQAIAELLVLLVALTVALAAVLQCCLVGDQRIRNLHEARAKSEADARSGLITALVTSVGNWEDGGDALRHTADDMALGNTVESLAFQAGEISEPFGVQNLGALGFHDGMGPSLYISSRAMTAGLYEGEAVESVPIEPTLRTFLFLNKSDIDLRDTVYMPGYLIDTFEP